MSVSVKEQVNKIIMETDMPDTPAAPPTPTASDHRAKNMALALEVVASGEKLKALYVEKMKSLDQLSHLIFLRALWPVELPKDAKVGSRWVVTGPDLWLEVGVNGEWKRFTLKELPPQMLPDRQELESLMKRQEYSMSAIRKIKELRTKAGLSF